ncbi:SDR family NAD(P)-dependent oxidoreductase [Mycolicibacterium goodii]|uniref:SDR family NAD(P)-dependent oxidoreductase n=1 Tax=Mycolicibacterium goodii TaxID=134601 RepID=UPI000C25FD2F|nr:SDR family oxidoreductase [Mycolicibacterium goodii]PJK20439.1 oxidoreductase [Mycolicibacterium goodii]
MVRDLSGKVAIVTGGASGLGRAMVERFVSDGGRVVVADVNASDGERLARELGPTTLFRRVDVSEPAQVTELVNTAVACFGSLDVMVNNAAVAGKHHTDFLDDDLADFDRVMSVNLRGVMVGTREAARHMAANGGGSIINMSSIGGVEANPGVMTYGASKAAVIHFSKSAALALADREVRVNCIAPGHIRTNLLASSASDLPAEALAAYEAQIREVMRSMRPLQREGTGEDVAEAAAFLAGDGSKYVTGIVLPVDGGVVAGNTVKPPKFTMEVAKK